MGFIARTVAAAFSVILAVTADGYSQEWTFLDNEFLIKRDFSEIVISGPDAGATRLFIDPIRNVPNGEAQQLRRLVLDSLRDKVLIADSKEHANYWLQILFQEHQYPIRNPNREFAHGSVVFAICRYPIKEMLDDCENLTYFYFFDSARSDLFKQVFSLWMATVLRAGTK